MLRYQSVCCVYIYICIIFIVSYLLGFKISINIIFYDICNLFLVNNIQYKIILFGIVIAIPLFVKNAVFFIDFPLFIFYSCVAWSKKHSIINKYRSVNILLFWFNVIYLGYLLNVIKRPKTLMLLLLFVENNA